MRNRAALLALVGLAAICSANHSGNSGFSGTNSDNSGGIPENPKRIIPKGAQLFNIHGIEVIALSRKNAYKKVRKSNPELF